MTLRDKIPVMCICLLAILVLFVVAVEGVPVTGAAILVGTNNVTIPLTGCAGNDAWVVWGQNPEGEIWNTANQTVSGGNADIYLWGAPLLGSTVYYVKGCDQTGCGNEISFTTPDITPLPTTTFGAGYTNLTASHFNVLYIAPNVETVYTTHIPRLVLYGVLIGLIFVGLWLRTRSIRIVSTLGLITGGMLFTNEAGLYLGVPGSIQLLGGVLLAAGLAGWAVALWLKK